MDLIKDFYRSFKNKDIDYQKFCHDDIRWIAMDGMPEGGIHVGIKSVFEGYFPRMMANFGEFHAHPIEFLEIDDKVIVFGRYNGQSKAKRRFDVPFCHVYKIRDNKISQFNQFTDTEEIQKAIRS
jgi:ketosteroid isomerase-like protein